MIQPKGALALVAIVMILGSIFLLAVSKEMADYAIQAGVRVEAGVNGVKSSLKDFDGAYGSLAGVLSVLTLTFGTAFPEALLGEANTQIALAFVIGFVGFFVGLMAASDVFRPWPEGCVCGFFALVLITYSMGMLVLGAIKTPQLGYGPFVMISILAYLGLLGVANFISFLATAGHEIKSCGSG